MILAADGFATHVKLLGSVRPDPSDRPGHARLRRPAAGPAAGIRRPRLRLRTRALRLAAEVRARSRSKANSCPGTRAARTRHSTGFMDFTGGPERRALPGRHPAVRAEHSKPASPTTPPARTARSARPSPATTANRTSPASTSPRRPGFAATLEGRPVLPGVGDRHSCTAAATRAAPSWPPPPVPAASQIGTATSRRRRRQPSALHAGKVYLAGPYKGAPLSLVVVVPAVSGPYDLGNVVVRVGDLRRSGHRPGEGGLRSDPADPRRGAAAARARCSSTSTGRASRSTRPTATRSASTRPSSGDEGAVVRTSRATSRSPTAPT